jgi:S-formylglutathione hydrolase
MSWSTWNIADHPVDLYSPSTVHSWMVFLYDTSGKTPKSDASWTDFFEETGLACVCPHGGQSWWSNRVYPQFDPKQSAEQYLIKQLRPWIEQSWKSGLAIVGCESGGQGALRLAFKYPDVFPVVGALDAAVDHYELHGMGTSLDELYDSREQCRQDGALLHIHPSKHPQAIWFGVSPTSRWFRGNDRLHEKLSALGVAHEAQLNAASATPESLRTFLRAALAQQRRRLL